MTAIWVGTRSLTGGNFAGDRRAFAFVDELMVELMMRGGRVCERFGGFRGQVVGDRGLSGGGWEGLAAWR